MNPHPHFSDYLQFVKQTFFIVLLLNMRQASLMTLFDEVWYKVRICHVVLFIYYFIVVFT